jgi:hypothetical protein
MRSRRFLCVPLLLCCSLSGCFLAMHNSVLAGLNYEGGFRVAPGVSTNSRQTTAASNSGPWEYGGGVRLAPGFQLGSNQAVTAHPMVSYTYLSFDGGSDKLYELGGQVRWRPTAAKKDGGFWIGGEAAAARLSTSFSGPGSGNASSSANGWALTGLIGMPVGSSRWGLNAYAGAGISHYGTSGKNIRAGIDLQPWFLKRSR